MWFERTGLEQATAEPVARHKARRFAGRTATVIDLCCGIGGDTLALADWAEVVAVDLDETHFLAQLKLSELFYRLRALPKAEEETLKAVNLAHNGWELSLARKQLQEIRRLIREGTQKPAWVKSLKTPTLAFVAMVVVIGLMMVVTT